MFLKSITRNGEEGGGILEFKYLLFDESSRPSVRVCRAGDLRESLRQSTLKSPLARIARHCPRCLRACWFG